MELHIRRANLSDVNAVDCLYSRVHEAAEQGVKYNAPTWRQGQYPNRETAKRAVRNEALHIGLCDDVYSAAVILNQEQYDGYERAPWRINVPAEKVLVINTLVVDPAFRGKQVGRKMVEYAKAICMEMHCETIRLSTYSVNIPAVSLYVNCGFIYLCDLSSTVDGLMVSYAMFDWLASDNNVAFRTG